MSERAPPSPGSTLPPTPLPTDHSLRPFAPAPFQPVPSFLHPQPLALDHPCEEYHGGRGALILYFQPKSAQGNGGQGWGLLSTSFCGNFHLPPGQGQLPPLGCAVLPF